MAKPTPKKKYYYGAVSSRVPEFSPLIETNPYTDIDYEYFEDAWANTLFGNTVDTLWDFTWGKGIKLNLELINKKGKDEDTQAKELESYADIIDKLVEIDSKESIQAESTFFDASKMAAVFGRSLVAKEPEGIKVRPDVLKIFHPRDLGRVYRKDYDWSVSSVNVNLFGKVKENVKAEDMIYFVNQPNNPIRRNIGYGFSEAQRVIGAARSMRRFVEFDSPEIIQSLWAGYGMLIVRPQSKSPSTDLTNISGGLNPGAFQMISANPEDIKYEQLKIEAEVDKLVKLMDAFERLIIGNQGVPAALLGRESDTNMATLLGKIRLFLAGPVMKRRKWIAGILQQQWYSRNLAIISPEAVNVLKVKVEFEMNIVESWVDVVAALKDLRFAIPELPTSVRLKLANLEQYKNEVQKEMKTDTPPTKENVTDEITEDETKDEKLELDAVSFKEQYATIKDGTVKIAWQSEHHQILHDQLIPHSHVFISHDGRRHEDKITIISSKLYKSMKKQWKATTDIIIDDLTRVGKLETITKAKEKFDQA